MKKVITYGTYDLLHHGHIRLLERAKALGDYLIVGVTSDDFDKQRGKINVQQSLMERVEAVRATGLADEIIIEEYEGQKIDDIRRMHVDIFTVGSDWAGKFDYLNEFCKVVYLDRTEGVSSSDIRSQSRDVKIGLVGELSLLNKFYDECSYVDGVEVSGLYTLDDSQLSDGVKGLQRYSFAELVAHADALYVASSPALHYGQIKCALQKGKHVICESPVALKKSQCEELFRMASDSGLILFEEIKTAFSTAFNRLLLIIKSGKIGDVVSVDATCTSIRKIDFTDKNVATNAWNSICFWGPTAMLPIFRILGAEYSSKRVVSKIPDRDTKFDVFSRVDFVYPSAVASIKVGNGVKSEGELVISGTKGYIYVPAPWWKTDYYELRFENPADNLRGFYQLEGEGIRNSIVYFIKSIQNKENVSPIDKSVSVAISTVLEDFYDGKDLEII